MSPSLSIPVEPLQSSPEARSYRRRRLALQLIHLALLVAALLVLAMTPPGRGLERFCLGAAPGPWAALLLYILFLAPAWTLLEAPLEVWSYLLERSHGLTKTSPARQVWEAAKGRLVGAVIGLPLLLAFYACLLRWPGGWWLPVGAILFLFGLLLARLGPTLLLPLFLKQEPVAGGPLRERLERMCAAEGVPVVNLFRLELSKLSLKANAAFAGLGRSRRILLADNLLDHFEDAEIEAVVAHELGHRCLRHIPRGIALGLVTTVAGLGLAAWAHGLLLPVFGFEAPSELAALPLLALVLVLYGLVVMPLQNGLMRRWEFAADRFAARRTSPEAMGAALRRLAQRNLADPDPPRLEEVLLHDHPSLNRRLAKLADRQAW